MSGLRPYRELLPRQAAPLQVQGVALGMESYYLAKQRRYKCKECWKQYTVKMGTLLEDSPISLTKWLPALWMLVNDKNGISSYELAKALGITQKSAWFVLHRLRTALQR